MEKIRFEYRTPTLTRIHSYSLVHADAQSSVRIFPKQFGAFGTERNDYKGGELEDRCSGTFDIFLQRQAIQTSF